MFVACCRCAAVDGRLASLASTQRPTLSCTHRLRVAREIWLAAARHRLPVVFAIKRRTLVRRCVGAASTVAERVTAGHGRGKGGCWRRGVTLIGPSAWNSRVAAVGLRFERQIGARRWRCSLMKVHHTAAGWVQTRAGRVILVVGECIGGGRRCRNVVCGVRWESRVGEGWWGSRHRWYGTRRRTCYWCRRRRVGKALWVWHSLRMRRTRWVRVSGCSCHGCSWRVVLNAVVRGTVCGVGPCCRVSRVALRQNRVTWRSSYSASCVLFTRRPVKTSL